MYSVKKEEAPFKETSFLSYLHACIINVTYPVDQVPLIFITDIINFDEKVGRVKPNFPSWKQELYIYTTADVYLLLWVFSKFHWCTVFNSPFDKKNYNFQRKHLKIVIEWRLLNQSTNMSKEIRQKFTIIVEDVT